MNVRTLFIFLFPLLLTSCYEPERDCTKFKTGSFSFTEVIDGVEQTTTFIRTEHIEIDYYKGKSDTSSIRWINDCEYIVKQLNPKNNEEAAALHMKILSTTHNSYIFEYGLIGSGKKFKGTAIKTN